MVSEDLPRFNAQAALYARVLEAAGDLPVTFRTLDLGGDKVLPYLEAEREDNPALGWRAIRMGLDRPALLRLQLRALIAAARGRPLQVMFPLVASVDEFRAARALVDQEVAWAQRRGRPPPSRLDVGAMIEAPALIWHLDALLPMTDFVSVGTNDLMQYLFAADRGNPRVADRYDPLSPPALRALKRIQEACAETGTPVSVCGEMAGRPLEAFALVALGFERLVHAAGRHRSGQADGAVVRSRGRAAGRRDASEGDARLGAWRTRDTWRESFMSLCELCATALDSRALIDIQQRSLTGVALACRMSGAEVRLDGA